MWLLMKLSRWRTGVIDTLGEADFWFLIGFFFGGEGNQGHLGRSVAVLPASLIWVFSALGFWIGVLALACFSLALFILVLDGCYLFR